MLPKNASLRHIALAVHKLDECESFYNVLGMRTELKTENYVYLAGNGDNLSLHQMDNLFMGVQRLEHIGFALDSVASVNQVHQKLEAIGIKIHHPPKTFGVGTYSFSVLDPDGIEVEFTFHPPMWNGTPCSYDNI
jgi:catechol 2,3-dioxygenase-like lactoylglutathione lyase family enzyme